MSLGVHAQGGALRVPQLTVPKKTAIRQSFLPTTAVEEGPAHQFLLTVMLKIQHSTKFLGRTTTQRSPCLPYYYILFSTKFLTPQLPHNDDLYGTVIQTTPFPLKINLPTWQILKYTTVLLPIGPWCSYPSCITEIVLYSISLCSAPVTTLLLFSAVSLTTLDFLCEWYLVDTWKMLASMERVLLPGAAMLGAASSRHAEQPRDTHKPCYSGPSLWSEQPSAHASVSSQMI